MTADAHADAVRALIGTAVRLHEGARPDGSPLPAAVLYVGTGPSDRGRLAPVTDRRSTPFRVTSVGLDPEGVRSVQERVRAAVLDKRPTVAGYQTWPVQHDDGSFLMLDRDVTPHVFYVVDEYSYASTPAPAPTP